MGVEEHHRVAVLAGPSTRRAALHGGGALLAALGAFSLRQSAFAQATPGAMATEGGLLLVQSFSQGSLFPTQGEAGVLPYTIILWDAADRGLFFIAPREDVAGFVPTDSLIIAIEAGERPSAALVVPAAPDGSKPLQAWALRLAYGGLGSDPGAVTYQGDALVENEAASWLGTAPDALPDGPRELAGGFLVIAGLPGLDMPEGESVRLAMA